MAEYIEREAVCVKCNNKEYCHKEKCPLYKVPAADVVEVRHGVWVRRYGRYGDLMCSECRANCFYDIDELGNEHYVVSDYCPCCGAKMDGKGDAK